MRTDSVERSQTVQLPSFPSCHGQSHHIMGQKCQNGNVGTEIWQAAALEHNPANTQESLHTQLVSEWVAVNCNKMLN